MPDLSGAPFRWRKSSKCEAHTCVEVAQSVGHMSMRNSTAPQRQITFSADTWRDFIAGVRAGTFDPR